MLVYANHLKLIGSDAPEAVFRAIGVWLKEQLGFGLRPDQLKRDGQFKGKRGLVPSRLRVYTTSEETPELYAWVLKHRDDAVKGRQWITELGVILTNDTAEFSCIVRTDEYSTLVAEAVSASQPGVVPYLLSNARSSSNVDLAASVPGSATKTVGQDIDSYRGLLVDIERRDRDYPVVLVSPTKKGDYLLNVHHLQEKLFGLAQVVRVTEDYSSYEMVEILGQPWSAWDGAVNVLHTATPTGFIRGLLFRSDKIESWGDTQHDRISKVLAWVTANTNIPRLRYRIRPEGVVRLAMRRRLEAVRARGEEMGIEQLRSVLEKAGQVEQEQSEWIKELEQDNDRLEAELKELRASAEDIQGELRKKEFAVQSLKDRLSEAGAGRIAAIDEKTLIDLACRTDQPTPLECLDVVQSTHGDKCTILDSARQSAKEMNRFEYGRQLLSMLMCLVTEYRTTLMNSGDSQAKKCFGQNEFAATESKTVIGNKKLLRARTFEYRGQAVPMLRHLKIGTAEDKGKTIRIHFHWDSEKKQIVIGYCGPHLPIPSH